MAVWVEMNDAGAKALLKSAEVQAMLRVHAEKISSRSKATKATVETGAARSWARVETDRDHFAPLCASGNPFRHPNCTATKALREEIAGNGLTRAFGSIT